MERSYPLESGKRYKIEVSYAFGTSDFNDINTWTIITGVHQSPPLEHDGLIFQEKTSHGMESVEGRVWLDKEYEFTAEAGEDGALHIAIGVWGTWETARAYFLDDLQIDIDPLTSVP